jgi:acetate---CoA ligase (ADP-forming)
MVVVPIPVDVQDVLLSDGSTAIIRAARVDDDERILDLHHRMSLESVILRFCGFHRLTDKEVAALTHADGHSRAVLVAERDEAIIGLAQYIRDADQEDAEVSFEVEDRFQGFGVGTLLLEHLASLGRRHGVRRFAAMTLCENFKMLGVFRSAGFASRYHRDSEVMHVVLDIAPTSTAINDANERDKVAIVESMRRLLQPHSIAVVGASRTVGSIGNALVRNLVDGEFAGSVFPVNPSADHISGVPCWPSVQAIPRPVDLAIIAVPPEVIVDTVHQCGLKGVKGLVIVTAGFAETGDEGAATQQSIVATAHEHGMRIIGPNCFGVVNGDPTISMNATFATTAPPSGHVAFASQSGGLGISLLAEANERGLGLSGFVSMGNKADVSGNDLLTYWEEDDNTKVILLYLESLGNPRKFARIARRVSQSKPIVALKAGRSAAGARAASSHTAALASPDDAVEALFRRTGVVRVDSVAELFDVAEVLAGQPIPAGPRVAIVGNAGGPGVLAADACAARGLVVPELSPQLQATIGEHAATGASLRNPVDLVASASPETIRHAVECIKNSEEADAVIVVFAPPIGTLPDDVVDAVKECADGNLPIIACFLGSSDSRRRLLTGPFPVPCFAYPESASGALARAVEYGMWRTTDLDDTDPQVEGNPNAARQMIEEAADPAGWLSARSALELLSAYNIPVVQTITVMDASSASRVARSFDTPIAIKAVGTSIVHKTDVGGVALNVQPEDAFSTFAAMCVSVHGMDAAFIQPMLEHGVELIVGGVRDESFGARVVVGLGGVAVEVLGDHQTRLAPVSARQAREMLRELKCYPLLQGWRGASPCDEDAIVDMIVRIGHLLDDMPEIVELDCNPVMCSAAGARVVDCRIRVATPPPVDDVRHLARTATS